MHAPAKKRRTTKTNAKRQRFPRLIGGKEAAALEKLLWVAPNFEVRLTKTKQKAATKLIFTIPISAEFSKSYPKLYWAIAGRRANDWENAIADGYWKTIYNKKVLPKFISSVLHRAFKKGVRIWLYETWGLQDDFYKEHVGQELSDFDKHAITKTGPQPDPRVALWTAKRFNRLLPAAQELRNRLKSKAPSLKDDELQREIKKVLPYGTFLDALQSILAEQEHVGPREFFNTPRVTPRQVVRAMLKRELEKRGYSMKKISLQKFLKLGNILLESFAHTPKRPS